MDKGQVIAGDRFGDEMGTFLAGQGGRFVDEEGDLDTILEQRRSRDYDSELDDETEKGTQVETVAVVYSQANASRQRSARSRQSSSAQVSRVTSPMCDEDQKDDINPILSSLRSMKDEADERRKKEKEEDEKQRKKENEEDEKHRNKEKEEDEKHRKKEKEEDEKHRKKEKEEDEKHRNKEKEEAEKQRNKEKEEAEKQRKKEKEKAEKQRKEDTEAIISHIGEIRGELLTIKKECREAKQMPMVAQKVGGLANTAATGVLKIAKVTS
ncbi:nucleolar protein 58-like [Schistocerca gregaria]|uniref:nucleolar protein 58-like n=1 Tax=Schistocerca gregaria TaxID=7010 RepID=UPI00211EF84F|nr:nucleolar protein 58-like [Schistocerca gregaria]